MQDLWMLGKEDCKGQDEEEGREEDGQESREEKDRQEVMPQAEHL